MSEEKFEELLQKVSPFIQKKDTLLRESLPARLILQVPSTEKEWNDIENEFNIKWNFPTCCGAMDGKHCVIRKPGCTGSEFYNYKHTFGIILFALVDANYCFTYIDVGTNGRVNDARVF
ncbi:hypothetical protein NQ314_002628 [Rhamnusium bicolor]|uniref:DDE Tnp4 domain-containing protein n=1 Tax=Rhamnusium bicolor TaxID=1586634 RepID=A0AAV8ZR80_9CUCU|nr:hypothetical protein NQ314_002628 [Rhamnusium bicolor]